jgi:hypothetical protein
MDLDRRFAEYPILPDSDAFVRRVGRKLDRGWTFRRLIIGGLGLAGGVIGAGQLLGSGLFARLDALTAQSRALSAAGLTDALARSDVAQSPLAHGVSDLLAAGSTMDGQILWMSAALAAIAVGFLVTRAIREI